MNTGSDIAFDPVGDIRVTLPAGTVITPATGTGFNASLITTASATVTSGLGTNEVSQGAIEFGISGVGLNFSKPIKIEIPAPSVTTSTIAVKVKHGGTSTFVTTGLTNNPSATCTNGIPSIASNIATVTSGVATIYTCSASTFTVVGTTTSSSNAITGAGGGGTSYASSLGQILQSTTGLITSGEQDLSGLTEEILQVSELLFRDIANNWAKTYIEKLAMHGIIRNAINYSPDNNLTRAEFVKMVVNALGIDVAGMTASFADVPTTHTLSPYIAAAVEAGLINGDVDMFRPNDSITRAEAMKILVLALGNIPTPVLDSSFADVDPSSTLAKYIEEAKNLGVISGQMVGGDLFFRPSDSITRAEIAKTIAKAFEF